MANPAILQRNVLAKLAKEGQPVTVSWPAPSGKGGLNKTPTATQAPSLTCNALIYSKRITLSDGSIGREVLGLFPKTDRRLTGGNVTTLTGEKYVIKSVVVTAPNGVVVVQEVVLG